jgi:hypothetical protein
MGSRWRHTHRRSAAWGFQFSPPGFAETMANTNSKSMGTPVNDHTIIWRLRSNEPLGDVFGVRRSLAEATNMGLHGVPVSATKNLQGGRIGFAGGMNHPFVGRGEAPCSVPFPPFSVGSAAACRFAFVVQENQRIDESRCIHND